MFGVLATRPTGHFGTETNSNQDVTSCHESEFKMQFSDTRIGEDVRITSNLVTLDTQPSPVWAMSNRNRLTSRPLQSIRCGTLQNWLAGTCTLVELRGPPETCQNRGNCERVAYPECQRGPRRNSQDLSEPSQGILERNIGCP